jgi:PiT family inorganic phosphate transporter
MSELALHDVPLAARAKPNFDQKPHVSAVLVFILLLVSGIGYAAYGILTDTSSVGEPLALTDCADSTWDSARDRAWL